MLNTGKPGLPPPGPSKKTIYIARFHDTQYHGPGRKFSIVTELDEVSFMPEWAKLPTTDPYIDGIVDALTPDVQLWKNYLSGAIPWQSFREKYSQVVSSTPLYHGTLMARLTDGSEIIVDDGDTLLCVCTKAKADDMRCHRAWAAYWLRGCNWRVMIDGRQLR